METDESDQGVITVPLFRLKEIADPITPPEFLEKMDIKIIKLSDTVFRVRSENLRADCPRCGPLAHSRVRMNPSILADRVDLTPAVLDGISVEDLEVLTIKRACRSVLGIIRGLLYHNEPEWYDNTLKPYLAKLAEPATEEEEEESNAPTKD